MRGRCPSDVNLLASRGSSLGHSLLCLEDELALGGARSLQLSPFQIPA